MCVLSDRINKTNVDYEAQPNDDTNIYFVSWLKQCKSESFYYTEIWMTRKNSAHHNINMNDVAHWGTITIMCHSTK